MKNKIALLISLILVFAVMIGVYFAKTSADKKKAEDDAAETDALQQLEQTGTRLTDCDEDNIKQIVLNNSGSVITIENVKQHWVASDYPDYDYDENAMQAIVYCFTSLFADNEVTDSQDNLAQYGLDNPVVTASSTDKDGNVRTVYLGTTTPDGNFYYAKVNDDPMVYIISALAGKSLCYGYDDILDKSVDDVSKDSVTMLDIKKQGSDDILVVFDSDDETSEAYHNTIGLAALTMKKPIENVLVYPYNLEGAVLYNLSQLKIGKLADPAPDDLSKYGLDNPYMTVSVKDIDGNSITVKAGKKADDFADEQTTYYYAMFDDKPQVFTVDSRAIEPFEEAEIIDFIQNFISLHKRSEVDKITIESKKRNYVIELKSEGENTFVTDDDGTKRDNRNAYINSVQLDKEKFSDFYEEICALSFDDITDDAKNSVAGKPEITITFDMLDGESDKAEYYSYNESFYAVKKGDNCSMLINKQAVNKLVADAESIAEK